MEYPCPYLPPADAGNQPTPLSNERTLSHLLLEDLEYMIKGPLFGCRMCGNCLLQETAFICPMECPEGPAQRSLRRLDLRTLLRGQDPSLHLVQDLRTLLQDGTRGKTARSPARRSIGKRSARKPGAMWSRCVKKDGTGKVLEEPACSTRARSATKTWDLIFRTVRQPDWWQGDDKYHAPAYTEPVSESGDALQGWGICRRLRNRAAAEHVHEEADREHQPRSSRT
ncbi:MAG: methylenetetrahydrofolate reductase C-terminal domain-containing protein [Ignavibacteriales bacterium]|nr:methylenetetrahydrofolate reductase C-terminal domain-containing protein [Ignavibacteriales bacterium]